MYSLSLSLSLSLPSSLPPSLSSLPPSLRQTQAAKKDGPTVIIFVIGGMTYSEMRAIYDVSRATPDREVIIGKLSTPSANCICDQFEERALVLPYIIVHSSRYYNYTHIIGKLSTPLANCVCDRI